MADLLGIARQWLSKIENGHQEVSPAIFLRFEALKRHPRFTKDDILGEREGMLDEPSGPYGAPTDDAQAREMVRLIEEAVDGVVKIAGNDLARLGWILEQAKAHLTPPANWTAAKRNPWATRRAPPEQADPNQHASGEGSGQASA